MANATSVKLNQLTLTIRLDMPGRVRRFIGLQILKLGARVYGFGGCDVKAPE